MKHYLNEAIFGVAQSNWSKIKASFGKMHGDGSSDISPSKGWMHALVHEPSLLYTAFITSIRKNLNLFQKKVIN